jgi:hypothetical protein
MKKPCINYINIDEMITIENVHSRKQTSNSVANKKGSETVAASRNNLSNNIIACKQQQHQIISKIGMGFLNSKIGNAATL